MVHEESATFSEWLAVNDKIQSASGQPILGQAIDFPRIQYNQIRHVGWPFNHYILAKTAHEQGVHTLIQDDLETTFSGYWHVDGETADEPIRDVVTLGESRAKELKDCMRLRCWVGDFERKARSHLILTSRAYYCQVMDGVGFTNKRLRRGSDVYGVDYEVWYSMPEATANLNVVSASLRLQYARERTP